MENLKDYQGLLEQVKNLPQPKFYVNSNSVVNVSGFDLTVWDTITAAIISNLNVLLMGERGEGKTQLENELKNTYFGGNATYIRMRDNLRVKDVYEVYNLGKLFKGEGTTLESKELTGAVKNPLTIIDEINRAHEKVQNQVYDIYDGYIIFEGPNGLEKIALGIPMDNGTNFHSAVASANYNSNRYAGISPIDSALLDRAHLILNVDNYTPTPIDNARILADGTGPKILDHHNSDHTQEIIEIHRGLNGMKLNLDALVALLYLNKGIDHCINPGNPLKSKRPILQMLPEACEGCRELGNGCGYTYPLSTRSEKTISLLAKGLKVVGDSKSQNVTNARVTYQDILSTFGLAAPYSGMLDENWVRQEFMGNEHFAIKQIQQQISADLVNNKERIKKAYLEAASGKLSDKTIGGFKERWGWFSDLLISFNEAAQEFGNLNKIGKKTLETAALKFPILRWIS